MIFQTVKSEEDDARRKEITLLLAADNVDNESQMDIALHGELAGKIVEQIFEQASEESCRTKSKLSLTIVFSLKIKKNYSHSQFISFL